MSCFYRSSHIFTPHVYFKKYPSHTTLIEHSAVHDAVPTVSAGGLSPSSSSSADATNDSDGFVSVGSTSDGSGGFTSDGSGGLDSPASVSSSGVGSSVFLRRASSAVGAAGYNG